MKASHAESRSLTLAFPVTFGWISLQTNKGDPGLRSSWGGRGVPEKESSVSASPRGRAGPRGRGPGADGKRPGVRSHGRRPQRRLCSGLWTFPAADLPVLQTPRCFHPRGRPLSLVLLSVFNHRTSSKRFVKPVFHFSYFSFMHLYLDCPSAVAWVMLKYPPSINILFSVLQWPHFPK